MARISGIDLPRDKRIEIGLTYIYGIGHARAANEILEVTGIDPDIRVKDLTEEQEAKLRDAIEHHYTIEGDLRRETAMNIKRLSEIGCYRGMRHQPRPACAVASGPRPTPVPARVPRRPLPTRRSKEGYVNGC